jgi:anti-anti-sigma regulatory factor
MTCKFDRVLTPDGFVVLRVSGRIDGANVETLWELVEKEKTTEVGLAIDLTEVTLVSHEAVDVLTHAEASGIELKNCPAYVREWLSRQRECADMQVDNDA